MGEDNNKEMLERVSTLEVQVKDLNEVKQKLDSLYNLIMEMKLENAANKSSYVTKDEFTAQRKEMEQRLDVMEENRNKLFWAVVSSGLIFTVWLLEQLLHVSVRIGG